jgi:hypothetical protein
VWWCGGIDALISRAVVYGLLSAALTGVYLAALAAAGGLSGAGRRLSVPVLATVIAAAVLLPVRSRLQRRADQLFFGDRGEPYAAMARLVRQVAEKSGGLQSRSRPGGQPVTRQPDTSIPRRKSSLYILPVSPGCHLRSWSR